MKIVLKIKPNGNVAMFYQEKINFAELGKVTIDRLSTIEYDNLLKTWQVRDAMGIIVHDDVERGGCLDWEIKQASKLLDTFLKTNKGRGRQDDE